MSEYKPSPLCNIGIHCLDPSGCCWDCGLFYQEPKNDGANAPPDVRAETPVPVGGQESPFVRLVEDCRILSRVSVPEKPPEWYAEVADFLAALGRACEWGQAEIERLEKERNEAVAALKSQHKLWYEANQCQQQLLEQRDEARAEVERLRKEVQAANLEYISLDGHWSEERFRLTQEIERLKADRKSDTVRALDEIEREVAKEREACAKVVEGLIETGRLNFMEFGEGYAKATMQMGASAIRARGGGK